MGLHIAWQGEIHNRHELCRALALPAETGIAATIATAWQRWSTDFVRHLDGVLCLALFDGHCLHLYCDPSGLRSLYFRGDTRGHTAFSTQLCDLAALSGGVRGLTRRSLHEYLRFLDISPPNTIFEDVFAVEPGQLLRWSAGGLEVLPPPKVAPLDPTPSSLDEAEHRLGTLLHNSVRTRLADAARPAAFLSGGIDSSLICALAARYRPDLTALTVGFAAPPYDEAGIAARIAEHLGLRHKVLRFARDDYLAAFERLCQTMEQPMADPATPATLLAFEHCREHFDMVLDGTGADEAVGAMPPRHVRLAVQYASLLPRALRQGLVRAMRAVPGIAGYAPILDFEHPADAMTRWRGFTRPEIEALCGEPVSFGDTSFYRTFARFPRGAHFERYSALLDTMPSDRLSQSALITGLRVRYPFFDAETNRFLRQLRTDWRYLPGQPKRILRELLARYVPTQIWDLPKHGFDFPLQQFLAGDDYALVRKYLVQGRWLDRGLLRPDGVRSYARQFMAGDQRLTFRVWALVMLGAWLEQHEDLR